MAEKIRAGDRVTIMVEVTERSDDTDGFYVTAHRSAPSFYIKADQIIACDHGAPIVGDIVCIVEKSGAGGSARIGRGEIVSIRGEDAFVDWNLFAHGKSRLEARVPLKRLERA